AMYTEPCDGVVEIVGVATLRPFRRRGITTAVVSQAVRDAFAEGAEVACLTAADECAGRVYERLGFHTAASMLAYSASGGGENSGRETDQ
ncbi:MAG: GNAT family N-acetyltransferase, partial [Anaerolineae bacterium]|nr:GNAT family N-acetyltransferase [Anaerolineae bacterium]